MVAERNNARSNEKLEKQEIKTAVIQLFLF